MTERKLWRKYCVLLCNNCKEEYRKSMKKECEKNIYSRDCLYCTI